ncbi:hypothetical protein [Desulfolutivibrio sulfoxidireducens]|uniref:hypothetical protein n=1 Tax=Desulfolutivibrio sulfoxidireducens TaxID=2773299 RepID=UPI00159E6E30|nr:hypothetical protein [Desulfolutivibrio sulfoxidireducens]QLA17454.1 hypothetical protein GD605_15875 [Desulfolutivibrio sulfoxidireducens]
MYVETLSMYAGTSTLFGQTATGSGSASGSSSGSGGTVVSVSTTSIGREEIEVFASEILRRAEASENEADDAGTDGSETDASTDGQDRKGSALASALADAVDFIREEYGSDAATAAMGLVMQNVGDGALTEDSLGDGLVAALKFIDKNLGIAAGDAVMAEFNGALNTAINRYFENGVEEEFVAVETTAESSDILADTLSQAVADADETEETDDTEASSPEEGLLAMLRELVVRREAEKAAAGQDATAANPYAATTAAGLQTTGMLVDAAV